MKNTNDKIVSCSCGNIQEHVPGDVKIIQNKDKKGKKFPVEVIKC